MSGETREAPPGGAAARGAGWPPVEARPSDWLWLAVCFGTLGGASAALAWWIDPTFAGLTALGGSLVVLESWMIAMGALSRRPSRSRDWRGRWRVFLATLAPWVLGIALTGAAMFGAFVALDRLLGGAGV